MKNKLKEYKPTDHFKKHIDSYWFFRNNTGETISFPVVPDGCSDIIFYLNNSKKLNNLESPLVTGIMEFAKIVPLPEKMELCGIRFRPGILSFILERNMSTLKNNMCSLSGINKKQFKDLIMDKKADNKKIVDSINSRLTELLTDDIFKEKFYIMMDSIQNHPEISMNDLSLKNHISIKSMERIFNKRIGLSPKKFARIMRFQKAHKKISNEGLINLVSVALSSGYFDQAHFNREYKKLVGCNPNSETMSILYNTKKNI